MTTRSIITLSALCALMLVGAGQAEAAKEKFVRTKPHVNVSGPVTVTDEIVRLSVGLVQPTVLGGLDAPFPSECSGRVNLRVVDASSTDGQALAERLDIQLTPGRIEVLEYPNATGGDQIVFAVIAAQDMAVKGKGCFLRSSMEVLSSDRAEVRVEKFHERQQYGQVQQQAKQ